MTGLGTLGHLPPSRRVTTYTTSIQLPRRNATLVLLESLALRGVRDESPIRISAQSRAVITEHES